ncbi:E3 ubiquitin-protein ligase MARCHF3-like isoform X2 [Lycorma delicatula]|uniref:E3 ubiquitin-protein ligase MARCHF3-like isoform X2 n=1 Tax=Lycorma delicatula TaxID=130591 RepID=UPI003F51844A
MEEEGDLQNVVIVKSAAMPTTPTKPHEICYTSTPSTTPVCRICHEGNNNEEELASPCDCTGTMKYVHISCLEKWLSTSSSDTCEICKFRFSTRRHSRSVMEWFQTRMVFVGPFGLNINGTVLDAFMIDAVCLLVLTPLFLISVYLSYIGSIAYMQKGLWEGPGLAMLSFLILITYLSWSYSIIRFYTRNIRRWKNSNQLVRLIKPKKVKQKKIISETVTSLK